MSLDDDFKSTLPWEQRISSTVAGDKEDAMKLVGASIREINRAVHSYY